MNVARMPRPVAEHLAAPNVNDNIPGMLAGHEMSDLAGVPRQPAAETVAHYTRLANISAFPEHAATAEPDSNAGPELETGEAAPAEARPRRKWLTASCIGSFVAHITLFYALAVTLVAEPQEAVEEAGSVISVAILGDAELDAMAAGVMTEDAPPEPEVVEAEPVTPMEVAAAEPVEQPPVEPVTQPTVVAAEPVQQPEAEPVAAVEPEILTSMVPAEPVVAQPVPSALAPEPEKPVEVAEVKPVEPPPEKPVEVKPEPKPPEVKPEAKKPVDKPKAKPPAEVKERKPKGSAEGKQQQNNKRGSQTGAETAKSQSNSAGSSGRNGSGSAAVANYPGKVQAKIHRSVRIPSAMKRKHRGMTVRVKLTIGSSGQLASVGVARSSGVGELDKFVMDGVRRAAPFPPLPPEWGKSSWTFSQDVVITGR